MKIRGYYTYIVGNDYNVYYDTAQDDVYTKVMTMLRIVVYEVIPDNSVYGEENIVLIDTGHAKLMEPFYNLEVLRRVPGFENALIVDPYSGGKGNSIRYMSVAKRDNYMRAKGISNLFVGGEKAGFFVGHTEALRI